jgi:putative oxidoreductase
MLINAIARILLGLLMLAGGLSAFLMPPPAMPGLVGEFTTIFHTSHWQWFVAAAQIVAGVLFLANRYVPVALIITAGFLYNSFAFHITMLPPTVILPIIVTAIWVLAAWPYRALFAPIFQPKP